MLRTGDQLLQFLDELVNPNVKLSVAERFHFVEKMVVRGILGMRTGMRPQDTFNDRSVKLDGRVKLDGQTKNSAVKFKPKLDGRFRADGGINLSGVLLSEPAAGAARVPARLGRSILDRPGMAVKPGHIDGCGGVDVRFSMRPQMAVFTAFPGVLETARIKVKTGPADCYSGVLAKLSIAARTGHLDGCTAGERLNAGMRYCRRLGGRYRLDGSIKLNSGILYAV
jgi:hypothetical protein